jgi:hypothetical protein
VTCGHRTRSYGSFGPGGLFEFASEIEDVTQYTTNNNIKKYYRSEADNHALLPLTSGATTLTAARMRAAFVDLV